MDVLKRVYALIAEVVGAFGPSDFDKPTRATEWSTRALLLHLILDAQRGLAALNDTTHEDPDTDSVTYWLPFNPRNGDGGRAHAEYVREMAAGYPDPQSLVAQWCEAANAVVNAGARIAAEERIRTQDHVLTAEDLLRTLLVEATIHYLDLTVEIPESPEPPEEAVAEVRATLEVLLGEPLSATWDDMTFLLKGTGRLPLSPSDVSQLGNQAVRMPLLG